MVTEINALQGNNIQTDIINEVVDKTGKILLEAAANTFGKYTCRSPANENTNENPKRKYKLWFDSDCKIARKKYRQCKGKYRRIRNDYFFDRYKEAEKSYKKVMDLS